jgi:hypothetical protein
MGHPGLLIQDYVAGIPIWYNPNTHSPLSSNQHSSSPLAPTHPTNKFWSLFSCGFEQTATTEATRPQEELWRTILVTFDRIILHSLATGLTSISQTPW